MGVDMHQRSPDSRAVVKASVWFNTGIMAILAGLALAAALFVITHASLAIFGKHAGGYLNLLGVFLPGYHASPSGAWIGLLWGVLVGGFIGAAFYRIYAADALRSGTPMAHISSQADDAESWQPPVMLLSGHHLGIAVGALMAALLAMGTLWLVIRGTAHESVHAALLSNYLPGYSVDVGGALIGAADIFLATYVFTTIFAFIYNRVAKMRCERGIGGSTSGESRHPRWRTGRAGRGT